MNVDDAEVFTMERADNSWIAALQSPETDYIWTYAIGEIKEKAIEEARRRWIKNYCE